MAHNVDETVGELKDENLELKLDAIRKQFELFKTDMHRHLDLLVDTTKDQLGIIIRNTEKTNGSVARALERIAEIERQDNRNRLDELKKELEEHKKRSKFWTTISTNKWVAVPLAISAYALTYLEFRQLIKETIKLIF